jgi:hypothetical protein
MSLLRKDERPTLGQRLALWGMTAGVVVLLGGLVAAFVIVPVLLLQSSRSAEGEAVAPKTPPPLRTLGLEAPKIPPIALAEDKRAPAPAPAAPKREPEKISFAPAPKPAPPAPPPPAPPSRNIPAVDPEGFIRHWLVLAPIRGNLPFSGTQEVHRQQIPNEGQIRPKANDRVSFPDKERIWQKHVAEDYFIDFQKLVGPGRSDEAVAYAVCYVIAPSDMTGLKLKIGSDDQAKVYLNGAQFLVFDRARLLEKDQNVANDVNLRRGENLLVFKVVNEKQLWQGCLRFTDRNNQPVKNLQISLAPQ